MFIPLIRSWKRNGMAIQRTQVMLTHHGNIQELEQHMCRKNNIY
jgi:hypothetical protein